MNTLYSIGHGNTTVDNLVERLKKHRILALIDARSIPYSKHNPQFNRELLRAELKERGIMYIYGGANIGGLKKNEFFKEKIADIVFTVKQGLKVAVMCSEMNYKDCHRHSTIEPEVKKLGCTMSHINKQGEIEIAVEDNKLI